MFLTKIMSTSFLGENAPGFDASLYNPSPEKLTALLLWDYLKRLYSFIEKKKWILASMTLREARSIVTEFPILLQYKQFQPFYLYKAEINFQKENWEAFEAGLQDAFTNPDLENDIRANLLLRNVDMQLKRERYLYASMALRELRDFCQAVPDVLPAVELEKRKFSVYAQKGRYEDAFISLLEIDKHNPKESLSQSFLYIADRALEEDPVLTQGVIAHIRLRGEVLSDEHKAHLYSLDLRSRAMIEGKDVRELPFDGLTTHEKLVFLSLLIRQKDLLGVKTCVEKLMRDIQAAEERLQKNFLNIVATYYLENSFYIAAGNWLCKVLEKEGWGESISIDIALYYVQYLDVTNQQELIKPFLDSQDHLIRKPFLWLRWVQLQPVEAGIDHLIDTVRRGFDSEWSTGLQETAYRLLSASVLRRLQTLSQDEHPELLRLHDELVPRAFAHPTLNVFRVIAQQHSRIVTDVDWSEACVSLLEPTKELLEGFDRHTADLKNPAVKAFWSYVLLVNFINQEDFRSYDWYIFEQISDSRRITTDRASTIESLTQLALLFFYHHHDYFSSEILDKQNALLSARTEIDISDVLNRIPYHYSDLAQLSKELDWVIDFEEPSRALYARFSPDNVDEDTAVIRLIMHPGHPVTYSFGKSEVQFQTPFAALASGKPEDLFKLRDILSDQLAKNLENKGAFWAHALQIWIENQAVHPNIIKTLGHSPLLFGRPFNEFMHRLAPAFARYAFPEGRPNFFSENMPYYTAPRLSESGFFPYMERSEGEIAEFFRENKQAMRAFGYTSLWFFSGPSILLKSFCWDMALSASKQLVKDHAGRDARNWMNTLTDWGFAITGAIRAPELFFLRMGVSLGIQHSGMHQRDCVDMQMAVSFGFNHVLLPMATTYKWLPSKGLRDIKFQNPFLASVIAGLNMANEVLDFVDFTLNTTVGKGIEAIGLWPMAEHILNTEYLIRSRLSYGLGLSSHPDRGIPEEQLFDRVLSAGESSDVEQNTRYLDAYLASKGPIRNHLEAQQLAGRAQRYIAFEHQLRSVDFQASLSESDRALLTKAYLETESVAMDFMPMILRSLEPKHRTPENLRQFAKNIEATIKTEFDGKLPDAPEEQLRLSVAINKFMRSFGLLKMVKIVEETCERVRTQPNVNLERLLKEKNETIEMLESESDTAEMAVQQFVRFAKEESLTSQGEQLIDRITANATHLKISKSKQKESLIAIAEAALRQEDSVAYMQKEIEDKIKLSVPDQLIVTLMRYKYILGNVIDRLAVGSLTNEAAVEWLSYCIEDTLPVREEYSLSKSEEGGGSRFGCTDAEYTVTVNSDLSVVSDRRNPCYTPEQRLAAHHLINILLNPSNRGVDPLATLIKMVPHIKHINLDRFCWMPPTEESGMRGAVDSLARSALNFVNWTGNTLHFLLRETRGGRETMSLSHFRSLQEHPTFARLLELHGARVEASESLGISERPLSTFENAVNTAHVPIGMLRYGTSFVLGGGATLAKMIVVDGVENIVTRVLENNWGHEVASTVKDYISVFRTAVFTVRAPELAGIRMAMQQAINLLPVEDMAKRDLHLGTSLLFNHIVMPLTMYKGYESPLRELPLLREANGMLDHVSNSIDRFMVHGARQIGLGHVMDRFMRSEYAVRAPLTHALGLSSSPHLGIPEERILRQVLANCFPEQDPSTLVQTAFRESPQMRSGRDAVNYAHAHAIAEAISTQDFTPFGQYDGSISFDDPCPRVSSESKHVSVERDQETQDSWSVMCIRAGFSLIGSQYKQGSDRRYRELTGQYKRSDSIREEARQSDLSRWRTTLGATTQIYRAVAEKIPIWNNADSKRIIKGESYVRPYNLTVSGGAQFGQVSLGSDRRPSLKPDPKIFAESNLTVGEVVLGDWDLGLFSVRPRAMAISASISSNFTFPSFEKSSAGLKIFSGAEFEIFSKRLECRYFDCELSVMIRSGMQISYGNSWATSSFLKYAAMGTLSVATGSYLPIIAYTVWDNLPVWIERSDSRIYDVRLSQVADDGWLLAQFFDSESDPTGMQYITDAVFNRNNSLTQEDISWPVANAPRVFLLPRFRPLEGIYDSNQSVFLSVLPAPDFLMEEVRQSFGQGGRVEEIDQ